MTFFSYRSSLRAGARTVFSMCAASGFILSSWPAASQLGPTFLATPQGQRLTQQERADLELTQIAPDFQLYREWVYCLNETARSSLDRGNSIERATSLISTVCEGGELPLRASLARSVGLPRARRIIAILYANKLAEMKDRYTKLRTPAPGTLTTVQGWSVISDDSSCMAVSRSQGPLSLQTQVIRRTSTGYSLIIHTAGSEARARRDVQAGRKIIVLWRHHNPTQYSEQMFTSVPIEDGYAVETPLGPKLLSVLPNFDQFQRGSSEIFSIEGIAEVIGAVEGCYAQKFPDQSPGGIVDHAITARACAPSADLRTDVGRRVLRARPRRIPPSYEVLMTRSTMSLIWPALALAGCQQQSRTTMDLLQAGEPAVCTASDVEETLRRLIRPEGSPSEGYTISFADASLESFDKVVARATCNAALKVDGPNGPVIERTMIDYVVAPSAQDAASFIVSGLTGPFRERLQEAIADDEASRANDDRLRQDQQALAALVKPAWLIGRWVASPQGSSSCTIGPYDDYARGGSYVDQERTGRWRLTGQQVTVVLLEKTVSFTITEAATDEFTMQDSGGDERSFRRCSASEMPQAPEGPATAKEPEPEPEPTAGPSQQQDEAGSKAATSKEFEL